MEMFLSIFSLEASITYLKGNFPNNFWPKNTILATQKKRISWPVSSRVPG